MRSHSTTRPLSSNAQPAWPLRTRRALAAIALLTSAALHAAPLPSPPQQLTVAFTNAFPNGSVDSLTMPNGGAAIAATSPLYTGGTPQNIYTALTWVTNPVSSTLDLIYADAEQHKIWRLPGPSYQTPTLIFSWSGKGSGPPYPVGLAADTAGNVYVISPNSVWDNPGVWVLPITNAGTYGAPRLIDNKFNDPNTGKPVKTLALAEVVVAGTAATPAGAAPAAWSPLDLLVLVGDTFNTRVIRYSQAQIQSVLGPPPAPPGPPLSGPTSTVVTQAQFLTQSVLKIPPVAVGMDIGTDPNTHDVTLLFSTAGGRILDFDSAKNAFITPYATNLGFGLTRLKVGTFQASQYVFVGQLPGQILEFAAPPLGTSDTKPFASVSKGVSNPSDLAVTSSGSVLAGSCVNNASGCNILPQLALDITGPGTGNIPANGPIVADSCFIAADPRVTIGDGDPSYDFVPLNLGTFCANLPNVLLSANVFGGSGATGTGFYVAKITSGLSQYNSNTMTTPVNNTLTAFILNPGLVLGANPNCGSANGPVSAWGPLPGTESMIPEGTLIDATVYCLSTDPPPASKGNHPSVITEGTVVALSTAYVAGEFNSLQQAFNQIVTPPVQPPVTQIVDPTNLGIVATIQGYITTSLNYFNQQNFNCALNTLATAARYVNSTVTTNPTDFLAGPPPHDDENPSGTLLMRFDHLYYDVNTIAGNPPLTTDALNPATVVPACTTQQYSVTELPTAVWSSTGFGVNNEPAVGSAINANGQVTGFLYWLGEQPGVAIQLGSSGAPQVSPRQVGTNLLLYSNGASQNLSTYDICAGAAIEGLGINSSGVITGTACALAESPTAFTYSTSNQTFTTVIANGTVIGANTVYGSQGFGINTKGQVVGAVQMVGTGNCGNTFHTFLYDPSASTAFTDLGTFFGCSSWGFAINDSGDIAGTAYVNGSPHPYLLLYGNSTATDLGALGVTSGQVFGQAFAINASDQVTGFSYVGNGGGPGAFLYPCNPNLALACMGVTLNGTQPQSTTITCTVAMPQQCGNGMQSIGNLGGLGGSQGNAINASGQITGISWTTGNAAEHAFLFSNGTLTDLNSLISSANAALYTLVDGVAISDNGTIVVLGYENSNPSQLETFLLTQQAPIQ